jgi:cyclopropane fatty-acyl-phospholipid synthase-like methyltransferase
VLDVGCAQGHAVNLPARAFPRSRFTAYDVSTGGIAAAHAEAQAPDNTDVRFAVRDVAALNELGLYDLITAFDAIHDQAKPAAVLRGAAEALAADGTFLTQDIGASNHPQDNIAHPFAPFLYGLSTMHRMTVLLALDGAGLATVWGEQQAQAMLDEAGFTRVDVHRLEEDSLNNYYISRKG